MLSLFCLKRSQTFSSFHLHTLISFISSVSLSFFKNSFFNIILFLQHLSPLYLFLLYLFIFFSKFFFSFLFIWLLTFFLQTDSFFLSTVHSLPFLSILLQPSVWGCRIYRLHLNRGVRPHPRKWVSCIWHWIASDGEAPVLQLLGMWCTPLLPLLQNLLPRVISVRAPIDGSDRNV